MKKTNKFIYVILVIAIIAVLILSYLLITRNAIIERQAEQIELQAMETNGSNSYMTTAEHLNESVKVWNKTYAYDDYEWSGVTLKTSAYVNLSTSTSWSRASLPLLDEECLDPDRILSWTVRMWTSDNTSSTASNGYPIRSVRRIKRLLVFLSSILCK